VKGMKRLKFKVLGKILILCIILCFALNAFGEIHVKISPKGDTEITSAYLDELSEFELIIANLGEKTVNNLILEITVDPNLSLVEDHEEKELQRFEIQSIKPNEKITQIVYIKPLQLSTQPSKIFVNYGIAQFTDLSATFLITEESPVKVDARLLKTALNLGEENVLLFDVQNAGEKPVSNISASLITPAGVSFDSQPLVIDSLNAGEGFVNKEFLFTPKETIRGKKSVTLSIKYRDVKGFHSIEKNFEFDIQDRNIYLYIIVFVIIVLVVVSYFIKKPKKRTKILGSGKIEGSNGMAVRTKVFQEKKN